MITGVIGKPRAHRCSVVAVLASTLFTGISALSATEFVDLASYTDAVEFRASGAFEELGRGVTTCDFNGDGIGDMVIGVPYANGPSGGRVDAGELDVFFGRRARWPSLRLASTADIVVYGQEAGDELGMSVACADVNGDGFDDLVGGAWLADSLNNTRTNAGQAHVIFGQATPPPTIDLATHQAPVIYGFVFQGSVGNQARVAAGDVTGDGRAEILLATPFGLSPVGNRAVGNAYLLFGRVSWPSSIDLATTCDVRMYGAQINSSFGGMVWIGDLNLDSTAEVVVGAESGSGPSGMKISAGDVFILRGRAAWPTTIDLGVSAADYRFTGADAGDQIGNARDVDFGDLDADGTLEVWMGAFTADGSLNNLTEAGEVRLSEVTTPPPVQADLSNTTNWSLFANKSKDYMGGGVRRGDFNGDRFDDLVVESSSGDGPTETRFSAGEASVCFGPRAFPASAQIGAGEPDLTIFGRAVDDALTVRTSTDINGDGIDEVVVTLAIVFGQTPAVMVISHLDSDADGIRQLGDNCPLVSNADQLDTNSDDRGDACELDWDGDGAPDSVDCAPANPSSGRPPETTGVAFSTGSKSELDWSDHQLADTFDIARGELPRAMSNDYGSCQNGRDTSLADTRFVDTDLPLLRKGFFYLVRARNAGCFAVGSWGSTSAGDERVNSNPQGCP